jgi:hypothetical protein
MDETLSIEDLPCQGLSLEISEKPKKSLITPLPAGRD